MEISGQGVTRGVITRRADEQDMPDLLRIEEACFGADKFGPETIWAFVVRNDAFTVIAEDDGRIIGSAMCLVSEPSEEGRIASVAVLKEGRGKGIGSKLMDECEKIFRTYDLKKYTLEVEDTNVPALALYKSHGFEIVGMMTDFYGYGRDAYAMEKIASRVGRQLRVRAL